MTKNKSTTQMSKVPLRREFSAGGVVFRQLKTESGKFKIVWLVGKHSGYHKWVLPKGLIEEGESGWQAALREVEEELGVRGRLVEEKPIHTEKYMFMADYSETGKSMGSERRVDKYQESGGKQARVFKIVTFYLMEWESGDPVDRSWEMEDGNWFSYEEAREKLAFKGEKEALEKAHDKIH